MEDLNFTRNKLVILIVLAIFSAGTLIASNLAAIKLWDFAGIAVDGGLILFPLIYIVGDVTVELFGKKIANTVIWCSMAMNIIAVLTFVAVAHLPAYPNWEMQDAYQAIFGFAPRIVVASLLAYLVSQIMNNVIFVQIKNYTGEPKFWMRALTSSFLARFLDIAIFETVAFLGVLSFSEFFLQASMAFALGMLLEIILFPVTLAVVKLLKKTIVET